MRSCIFYSPTMMSPLIMSAIGYSGRLIFTDLGWRPRISLKNGVEQTYGWFKEHFAEARL
jgi:nucleoside-diphosphate-sugar epimerase